MNPPQGSTPEGIPPEGDPEELDPITEALLGAVVHPVRAAIWRRLGESDPVSAKGIAEELGLPATTVAEEMRRMKETGVIEEKDTRKRRGTVERFFGAAPDARVMDDETWVKLTLLQRKQYLVEFTRSLVARLSSGIESGAAAAPGGSIFWSTAYALDPKGWEEMAVLHRRAAAEVERVAGEASARLRESPGPSRRGCSAVVFFGMPERDAPAPIQGGSAGTGEPGA